jgi:NADPH:quinone reductase
MKAIVIHEYGGPEVLTYQDVPDPVVGEGEVVVRVHAVSVNRTLDIAVRAGRQKQRGITLPITPGVDPSGVVTSVGGGVNDRKVGDRVAVLSHAFSSTPGQHAGRPRNAQGQDEMIGIHRPGGAAELVSTPASHTFQIPDNVPFADATVISRHGPTAYHLLVHMADLQPGEWVLIMGASGNLGTLGIQLAKTLGANVIAVAGSDDRVQIGMDLGADHGINYRTHDLTEEARRLTGGKGVNVVYDNIANPETLPKAIAGLAQRGRLVTAGAHGGPIVPVDFYIVYHNLLKIMGNPGSQMADLAPCFEAAAAGGLRARVERIMKLSEAAEAHRLVEESPGMGKIILDPTLG